MTEIDPKLSRVYRGAATEGPPPALDAAILAAARRRIEQRRATRSSWVRWMAPASALATLVVAVSLAFVMEHEQPETPDGTAIRGVLPKPQSPAPVRATESRKASAADSAAPAAAGKKEAAAAPLIVPGDSLPVPVPMAPLPAQAPVLAVPVPAPVSPRAESSLRSAEPAPAAAQAFPGDSRAKASESKMSAPKAATESSAASDSAAGAAASAAAGRIAPPRQPVTQRSPEAWLEEIGRLKREGRDHEAADQLAEFRRAYPAYALPENFLK